MESEKNKAIKSQNSASNSPSKGSMRKQDEESNWQNGQSFNSIGQLEIPETVLEELLQNALVHIDLLKTAAIRLMVFDDRVKILHEWVKPIIKDDYQDFSSKKVEGYSLFVSEYKKPHVQVMVKADVLELL